MDYLLIGYDDANLYFAMMDAQRHRIYKKLRQIAVLSSNAENLTFELMESVVKSDVLEL